MIHFPSPLPPRFSTKKPTFQVVDSVVEVLDGRQILAVLAVHAGQTWQFRFECDAALSLAGQLEEAYQKLHPLLEKGGPK